MKTIFCFLALISFSRLGLFAQNTESFSLEEAIAYAEKNSNEVKEASLSIADAKAQVREYVSIGLPQINAKVDYNHFIDIPTQIIPAVAFNPMAPPNEYIEAKFGLDNNLTASATMSTLLFDGSYFVGLKASRGLLEMTKRQAALTKHDIKYEVRKAYYAVLIIEENVRVLAKNIKNLEKILSETRAYYDNGLIEQLDVDRLELSLKNLKSEAAMLDRQRLLAHNALKFQMNFPMQTELQLSSPLETLLGDLTKEDMTAEVPVQNRIEHDILNRSLKLNELNIRRYKMGYVPSLVGFFQYQQVLQRDNLFDGDQPGFFPATIVGLSLNLPIFDGFDKQAKINRAKISVEKIKLQINNFERGVKLEVNNARVSYNNAVERLTNQKENLVLAEKIMTTTKLKYKEGIGSSLELNQAEQELYRTQANYMNAMYDLVVAKNSLDKALGQ